MINETTRESKKRISEKLNQISFKTENDKSKFYSWKELRENNKIIEIKKEDLKRFDLKYCKIHGWSCFLGNKCWPCQSLKTGFGNPEIHAKTIKNQINNGTFNMFDQEVQRNKTSNKNLKKEIKELFCIECNKLTKHKVWENGSISCCICSAKNNGLYKKYCNKCKKETTYNGSICSICNPEAAIQNNLHYKYCIDCKIITYHNGNYCTKCNPESLPKCTKLHLMEINNCQIHPKEIYEYKGECFACFQEKFKIKDMTNFMSEILNSFKNSFIQPTFRTQDSNDWTDCKIAFEQSLVEKEIGWLIYIKFYINELEEINPLVIGKSGSLLVNNSGTDLIFSIDKNHGPARRFLKDNNYSWDKTQVLIIPFNTEKEALNLEKEIALKYKLFES